VTYPSARGPEVRPREPDDYCDDGGADGVGDVDAAADDDGADG